MPSESLYLPIFVHYVASSEYSLHTLWGFIVSGQRVAVTSAVQNNTRRNFLELDLRHGKSRYIPKCQDIWESLFGFLQVTVAENLVGTYTTTSTVLENCWFIFS